MLIAPNALSAIVEEALWPASAKACRIAEITRPLTVPGSLNAPLTWMGAHLHQPNEAHTLKIVQQLDNGPSLENLNRQL